MKLFDAGIIVGVAVVVAAWVAANAGAAADSGNEGRAGICYTKCAWFQEKTCEGDTKIGHCIGVWGCNAENGAHQCNRYEE